MFILKKKRRIIKYLDTLKINEFAKVEFLETKKNTHVYMKEELYESIKYYHGKFNSYSIALYVRMILRLFLILVERYGYKGALNRIDEKEGKLKKINGNKNKRQKIV